MRSTLRFGRIKGIEIGAHWSLLVIGALVTMSLATDTLPALQPDAGGSYWAAAVLGVTAFFASILAHELAHSVVAIRRGQRVEGITLWLFGGVARLKDEARDARSELLVALAGPATSLALGAAFIGAAYGLDTVLSDGSLLPTVAAWLGVLNIVLAVFNMLPGAPLDGGRVLSALVWMWRKDRRAAQIVAARVGRVIGYGLIALGVYAVVAGNDYGSIWTALIGYFIVEASKAEEMQARIARNLDDRTVADIMSPAPPRAHAWATVGQLQALTGEIAPPHVVLTDFGGAPGALLERAALRNATAATELRERAIPLVRLPSVPPDTPLRAALSRGMPVIVVAEGVIVGIVGFAELTALQASQGSDKSKYEISA